MKKALLFLIMIPLALIGQNDCSRFADEFTTAVKAKKFAEAHALYSGSEKKCRFFGNAVYQAADEMFRHLVSTAPRDKRAAAASDLIAFYADYDKVHAVNPYSNKVKSAVLLKEHFAERQDERYALLDEAFRTDLENFSDPAAMYDYFSLFNAKFAAADTRITIDQFIDTYLTATARLGTMSENPSATTAARGLKGLVSKRVDCAMLISYADVKFESKSGDTDWLKSVSEMMLDENCTAIPSFKKISAQWHSLRPSAESAYAAAVASQRSNDKVQAMMLFNAAASMETRPRKKAELYYILASNSGAKPDDAVNYAKKALEADPTFGKAYFMMAQKYAVAGADCASTPFERKALNILAAQTAAKAGVANPAMKAAATAQSEAYLKKAPTKEEIRSEKKAGQKLTFSCWINETITL